MAKRLIKRRPLTKYSIGDMRERISIESKSQSVGFNTPEAIQTFTVVATIWAQLDTAESKSSISPGGDQLYNGINIDTKTLHIFTIRHREGLNASNMYVRWKGDLYRIKKIANPQENYQYLNLMCHKEGDETLLASQ